MPYPEKYITGHYGTLSDFRKARGMQPHSGTDWARPRGTRIPAIAKGTVRGLFYSKVLGHVLVQTAMDKDGVIWYLGYCHMDSRPGYSVGDKLLKGQTVGLCGNSGLSSGPHVHITASRSLRGVFGPTEIKSDVYKLILENTKRTQTKQKDAEALPVVEPKLCKSCGQEIKK